MKNFLSRREFLRAAGVSGAVVPLLEAGRVQAAAPPRRLIVVAWTNGFSMPDFWPRGGERDFTLGQTLSPLEPFRDNMLFVGGLAPRIQMDANPKFFGGHHTYPALLNAWPLDAYNGVGGRAGGESVDQFIARQIAKQQLLRFPSLVLSAQWAPSTGALASNISYATKGGGITPQLDPVRLYEKVFMGELLPPETLRQIVGEKRSILDFVGESLKRYSKRLSALDREKIESHNESLRVIERRLQTLASVPGCQPPTAPPVVTQGGEPDANRILNYPLLVKAQMDLAHTSLACDLSRVVKNEQYI